MGLLSTRGKFLRPVCRSVSQCSVMKGGSMSARHRAVIVRYKGRKDQKYLLCNMLNIGTDEKRAKHCRTKFRKEVPT